jgi:hypothetical protein
MFWSDKRLKSLRQNQIESGTIVRLQTSVRARGSRILDAATIFVAMFGWLGMLLVVVVWTSLISKKEKPPGGGSS